MQCSTSTANILVLCSCIQETIKLCSKWARFKDHQRRANSMTPSPTNGEEPGLQDPRGNGGDIKGEGVGDFANLADNPSAQEKNRKTGNDVHATGARGHLVVADKADGSSINLDSWVANSCHWNCMVPVFIALGLLGLLPATGDVVTDQAKDYFSTVREVAEGMDEEMPKSLRVSVLRCEQFM